MVKFKIQVWIPVRKPAIFLQNFQNIVWSEKWIWQLKIIFISVRMEYLPIILSKYANSVAKDLCWISDKILFLVISTDNTVKYIKNEIFGISEFVWGHLDRTSANNGSLEAKTCEHCNDLAYSFKYIDNKVYVVFKFISEIFPPAIPLIMIHRGRDMRNKRWIQRVQNPCFQCTLTVFWVISRFSRSYPIRTIASRDYIWNNLKTELSDSNNLIFDVLDGLICNYFVLPSQRSFQNVVLEQNNFIKGFSISKIWVYIGYCFYSVSVVCIVRNTKRCSSTETFVFWIDFIQNSW